jgi:hypothetical protein
MSIDPPEAAAALDDIERIVQRVKQSEIYRRAGAIMIMWGAIVSVAYVAAYLAPRATPMIWIVSHAVGAAATIAFSVWRPRLMSPGGVAGGYVLAGAFLLFFGFGLLWSVVLGKLGPREMNVFWATLFMFGYSVAGLWFGRAFIVLGLTITALTLAGYFWIGREFDLYMALVNGGGLALCGLWMRRA